MGSKLNSYRAEIMRNVSDFCTGERLHYWIVKRVSWFSKIDYPIFGFLDDHNIRVTPKVVAGNIDYDRSYTGRRLRALRDAGLLEQDEESFYTLSDLGHEFLAGNLSKEELEALNPDKDVEETTEGP